MKKHNPSIKQLATHIATDTKDITALMEDLKKRPEPRSGRARKELVGCLRFIQDLMLISIHNLGIDECPNPALMNKIRGKVADALLRIRIKAAH